MSNESPDQENKLILSGPSSLGTIRVDTEAFFELSFWIAEELEDLVAQWKHVGPKEPPPFERRHCLPE
jgi:hypothetical protein